MRYLMFILILWTMPLYAQESDATEDVIKTDSTTNSTVTTQSDSTTGTQVTDENCERMKLAKNLYNMGMKVAAVSALCQDQRVFDAMRMAGTPCPFEGMIGRDAQAAWEANQELQPNKEEDEEGISDGTKTLLGSAGVASLLLLLLL
jgi:hypothetical protein